MEEEEVMERRRRQCFKDVAQRLHQVRDKEEEEDRTRLCAAAGGQIICVLPEGL